MISSEPQAGPGKMKAKLWNKMVKEKKYSMKNPYNLFTQMLCTTENRNEDYRIVKLEN